MNCVQSVYTVSLGGRRDHHCVDAAAAVFMYLITAAAGADCTIGAFELV